MKTPKFINNVKAVVVVSGEVVKAKVNERLDLHAGKKIVKKDLASMGAQLREEEAAVAALLKEQTEARKAQEKEARRLARELESKQSEAEKVAAQIEEARAQIEARQAQLKELLEEVNNK